MPFENGLGLRLFAPSRTSLSQNLFELSHFMVRRLHLLYDTTSLMTPRPCHEGSVSPAFSCRANTVRCGHFFVRIPLACRSHKSRGGQIRWRRGSFGADFTCSGSNQIPSRRMYVELLEATYSVLIFALSSWEPRIPAVEDNTMLAAHHRTVPSA
jgi:hypothetical protein